MSIITTLRELIREIEETQATDFEYPYQIVSILKNEQEKIIDQKLKPKGIEVSYLKEVFKSYREDIRGKIFYNGNCEQLCEILTKEIKAVNSTIPKNKNLFKSSELSYNLPKKKNLSKDVDNPIYTEWKQANPNKTEKEFKEEKAMPTTFSGTIPQFSIEDIKKLVKNNQPKEKEKKLNIFRQILLDDQLGDSFIFALISDINKMIAVTYPQMIHFFITDQMHNAHLQESIRYQKKIKEVFNSIKGTGSIESTRAVTEYLQDFLYQIITNNNNNTSSKWIKKNIKIFSRTGKIKKITPTVPKVQSMDLSLESDHFVDGSLKILIDNLKNELKSNGISFDREKDRFFKVSAQKYNDSILEDATTNAFSTFFPYDTTYTTFDSSGIITYGNGSLDIKDFQFFSTSKENNSITIEVKKFEDFIRFASKELTITFTHKSKTIDEINFFRPSSTESKISFKPLDLIEYVIKLSSKVRNFFLGTLNLKAVTTKKRFSDKWGKGRGYLDVGRSIESSLNQGKIYPIETYRKKLVQTPPTVFIIFDISGSMREEVRLCQFYIQLLVSFFERDIKDLIVGYIAASSEVVTFPSRSIHPSSGNPPIDLDVWDKIRKPIADYPNIVNEYASPQIMSGFRDFFDNEDAGKSGGTTIDSIRYLPSSPYFNNEGLKYVFILSDADFWGTHDKRDFVEVSKDLVDRFDVRYLFSWVLAKGGNYLGESSDSIIMEKKEMRTITKQYLLRRMRKEIDGDKDKEELAFYKFLYDNYDRCHLLWPQNALNLGEMKHLLYKLQGQDFFIT